MIVLKVYHSNRTFLNHNVIVAVFAQFEKESEGLTFAHHKIVSNQVRCHIAVNIPRT